LGIKSKQADVTAGPRNLSNFSEDQMTLLGELQGLSGGEIVDRILTSESPRELVESLPSGDFYWLIKRVGSDDCLSVLELASEGQWQYLLDLEIWNKDRLDLEQVSAWLGRIQEADSRRLVKWLLGEGQALAFYHVFNSIDVIVLEPEDEALDIPEGFSSCDGIFYIRARDPKYREQVEELIRNMAKVDFDRYQALLQGLAGLVPGETEEGMYRMRGIRLAEHGFLPFDEALSAYAPLDPQELADEAIPTLSELMEDKEIRELVPVSPLHHTGMTNLFTETVLGIADPLLLDRIRMEFAGLCNQILSADGTQVDDIDDLLRVSRKVGSHLNLGLERVCGRDTLKVEGFLQQHSLLSIHRVGIGLCLKVKWEAERWKAGSWFYSRGLHPGFWGEAWGNMLAGLLEKIPILYAGLHEGEEYKEFEWISELGEALEAIRAMMVLDGLLEQLTKRFPVHEDGLQSPEMTFRPLLFNLWARLVLDMAPDVAGITQSQAQALFERLRGPGKEPPYDMSPFEDVFVRDLSSFTTISDPDSVIHLKETLSVVWQAFSEEYTWITDLDGSYSKFITILS
jgi:hypothetical protein